MVLDRSTNLDRVFHALAHPARRAMLRQLFDSEQNLSELAAPLRMSFPAASKHVRVLEQANLVRRRVVGRTHFCRIEGKPLAQANEWLERYRRIWEQNYQRLDVLLDELKADENQGEASDSNAGAVHDKGKASLSPRGSGHGREGGDGSGSRGRAGACGRRRDTGC